MIRKTKSTRRRDGRPGGDLAERRAEEKMRRRAAILDAAEAIALADGWGAMTIVHVASRARLSRALVYVYFRDKADLLFGIRDRAVETLARYLSETTAQQMLGIAQLEAALATSAAFAEEHRIYFEALLRTEPDVLERRSRATPDLHGSEANPCRCAFATAIATGVADGSIRSDVGEPESVSAALWSFMYGVMQLAAGQSSMAVRGRTARQPLLPQAIELVLHSVCQKPAAGPAAAIHESLRALGPSRACPQ
jgi:AcrR family transcriptional regulator